jgi:GTP-binding protein
VGRPNVGKSTLFNRLIGRRKAITDPTPGVTRDPVAATGSLAGREVRFVDTGGYTTDADPLARAISERALRELGTADVILFLVDVTGATALDEVFLEQLRPFADRLIVVVNKLDTELRDDLIWDFYQLGVETVVGVSAAHGRGMDALADAVLARLPEEGTPEERLRSDVSDPGSGVIKIAVLGQPNTGKSTLVNRITETDASLVSDVPGTTRDVIEGAFERDGRVFGILDTAGIRRKKKVSENIEYYSVTRAIDTIAEADVVVLMVDANKGLSDQDKKIASLVVERGRGLVLALNKWDLLPQVGNQFDAVRDRILFLFPVISFAPMIPLSAQTGKGVDDLIKAVVTVHNQLYHRIDTGKLNRHLAQWLERTPPPVRGRGRLKIRYITQVQRLPVTFIAFVNRTKGFPDSYVGYLKNQIRADFGLSSIPFRLELRER